MKTTSFIFGKWPKDTGLDIELPARIHSKTTLLETFGRLLKFPDYYGVNWDAFEECIRDLSWLPERDIVVRHSDIPLAEDSSLARTYLLILLDAVEKWKNGKSHQLIVVFPEELKAEVDCLIAS